MKLFETTAQVISNMEIKPGYFRLALDCPDIACTAGPGQFVMIGLDDANDPLLRRPFSVHDVILGDDGSEILVVLYMVVGRGTKDLSRLAPGAYLQVLGPLGTGFSLNPEIENSCLVGGGIGVAPLVFLARNLSQDISTGSCRVVLGARSQDHILCHGTFEAMGIEVIIATEDGSFGTKGLVTDVLSQAIKETPSMQIFTCGPMPMLKAVAGLAKASSIPCQVSVEAAMACGMGACLGCALPKSDDDKKYLHACTEGPVLEANRLWK